MNSIPEFSLFNNETAILNELLPREIRKNTPTFVGLLEEYYRFLNQKDNPSYVIQRIIDEHDLDKVVDSKYLDKIQYEIARAIPTSSYVQKAFLLKRIIDSYGIRGNDESVLYFFRIFFNEDVSIYNPWEQVIIPSQGKWTKELKARVILYCGDEKVLISNILVQYDNQGREVARAEIENATRRRFRDKFYFDLVFRKDSLLGIFNNDFEICTIDGAAKGKFVRSLSRIKIKNKGSGYSVGDRIYLGGLENVTFTALVDRVDTSGEIIAIRTINNGISSSIHYFDSIPNDPSLLPNLSTIYISGNLNRTVINNQPIYTLETRVDDINLQSFPIILTIEKNDKFFKLHAGKFVDVSGVLTSEGIEVNTISDVLDENYVLYDFKYYDKILTPNYQSNNSGYQTHDKTVIATNKIFDAETEAEFEYQYSLVYLTDGFYADEKGRPSGFSVLQDSFYYQVFSYEINSSLSIDTWKSQIEELIHPTGFKLFNRINTVDLADLNFNFVGEVTIDSSYLPPLISTDEKFKITSSVNVISQDYNYSTQEPDDDFGNLSRIPDIIVGPYFAEDYTTNLELDNDLIFIDNGTEYDLIFIDNGTVYDLIFTVGVGTGFGEEEQGSDESSEDSTTTLNMSGQKFSNGYYRINGTDIWVKQ